MSSPQFGLQFWLWSARKMTGGPEKRLGLKMTTGWLMLNLGEEKFLERLKRSGWR